MTGRMSDERYRWETRVYEAVTVGGLIGCCVSLLLGLGLGEKTENA